MSVARFLLLLAIVCVACKEEPTPPPPPPSPPPPPTNQPPVARIGGPYSTTNGAVQFDGSASSDPDNHVPLRFSWAFGDGATGEGATPTHVYQSNGSYGVTLTVTDTLGASSAANTTALVNRPTGAGVVFAGAGNIGSNASSCPSSRERATATLLDELPGFVFTAGDNVMHGTAEDYAKCYDPTWGRHKARTWAVLGNHEYDGDPNASFDYFGDRVGPRGKGYYSVAIGDWQVVVLNDNVRGWLDADSEQLQWLETVLDAATPCTMVLWHAPLFLSSTNPGYHTNGERRPIWDILYRHDVDVVVNGQQHHYERFRPLTPAGEVDEPRGIRQFNVGTGGESTQMPTAIHPQSEVQSNAFGVLKFTLRATSYEWEFLPIPGHTFRDAGAGTCH